MKNNMARISDYLWFQEGPGVRNTQYTNKGVKLLNVANLVDGIVDLSTSERYISEEEAYGKYKHFLCDEGDFIIASSGIKVDYIDKKMGFIAKDMLPLCMNTSTIRFKVLDKDVLNIKYFMYYLKSNHYKNQLSKYITGSAQLNYGPSHLNKMKMPIIALDQQNNLVERLSKIESILKNYKSKITKLDELVKARFVEMFGSGYSNSKFPIEALGKYMTVLVDFNANGSYEKLDSNVKMYDEPNYAWMVRTTDLETKNYNDIKYIDKKAYELLSKSKIYGNELIMSKIGSAGKIYLMPNIEMPASLGRNAFLMRFDEKHINMNYLFYMLSTDFGTSDIINRTRGAVTKTITKDETRNIRYINAPIELQNEFSQFVEQIDKSKFVVQKQIEETQKLFDSLMQEYFG